LGDFNPWLIGPVALGLYETARNEESVWRSKNQSLNGQKEKEEKKEGKTIPFKATFPMT
jgi:hypothetical protein